MNCSCQILSSNGKKVLSILSGIFFLSGCAITNSYGPIAGKVIEKEAGTPIPNALVLVKAETDVPGPGGAATYFAGFWVTLTDESGEYRIESARAWTFRPFSLWGLGTVTIYKKGYTKAGYLVPPYLAHHEYMTSALSKRKRAGPEDAFPGSYDEAVDRSYVLAQIYDQERIESGVNPFKVEHYWRIKGFIGEKEKTISSEYYWRPKKPRIIVPVPIRQKKDLSQVDPRLLKQFNNGYSYRYEIDNYKEEILKALKENDIEFVLAGRRVVIRSIDKDKADKVIDAVYNYPHMIFINDTYADMFKSLMRKNNVAYEERTVPNVVGCDIIWKKEDDSRVDEIQFQFYRKILEL